SSGEELRSLQIYRSIPAGVPPRGRISILRAMLSLLDVLKDGMRLWAAAIEPQTGIEPRRYLTSIRRYRIMKARSSLILAGVGLIALGWFSSLAQADLGSLFRNLQFAGNRNFSQDPQNGPLFDNNIYKQGVIHNRLGQGWTYESFRFFGP